MKKKRYTLEDLQEVGYPDNLLLKYDFLRYTQPIKESDIECYFSMMTKVTEADLDMFRLRYKQGLSIKEIAERYQLTMSGVVSRIDKVSDKLMQLMKLNHVVAYTSSDKNKGRYHIRLTDNFGNPL